MISDAENSPELGDGDIRQEANKDASKRRLKCSPYLGTPPYVLDPADLPDTYKPFPDSAPHLRAPSAHTIVKYGKDVRLEEAEVMEFVARNTTVVCPKVIGAYVLDDIGYIIMSWEDAKPIDYVWATASEAEKEKVIDQLRDYVQQMRKIKGEYIGGFGQTNCIDDEFQWDFHQHEGHKYGPFKDEAAFNEGLIEALERKSPFRKAQDPESIEFNSAYTTRELIRSLKNHEIVLTHGDLHASNILIRKDFTVVLIDWATAGFYPDYWEFYKATWRNLFQPSFIRQVVRYIPAFWIEANILEQIYNKILGVRSLRQN